MIKLSVSPDSAVLVVSSKKVWVRAHISRETNPTLVVEIPIKAKIGNMVPLVMKDILNDHKHYVKSELKTMTIINHLANLNFQWESFSVRHLDISNMTT